MDALRFDHVTPEITPNLIRISKAGCFFNYALSGGSNTRRSIPCIISSNFEYDPEQNIAVVLNRIGYTTGCLHSNLILNDFSNGFDFFIDLHKKRIVSKKTRRKMRKLGRNVFGALQLIRRTRSSLDSYIPYNRADELVKEGLKWISDRSEPYFLWLHLMDPHIPYAPMENDLGLSTKEIIKINDKIIDAVHNRVMLTDEEILTLKSLYKQEIKFMDKNIGILYDNLEGDNIIFLTSDHGDEFGEHGGFSHKSKNVPELLHVPLIIVGEGIRKGSLIEKDVSSLDIAPTMLDLLGAPEERFGIGRSLKNLIVKS